MPDHATADEVVRSLLPGAGELALRWFRSPELTAEDKTSPTGFDPVTEADRAVEDHLRAGLSAAFPTHAVVGEERGRSGPADAEATWILDPIDGTKAFLTGVPAWGTLIGLLDGDGEPAAGWVHQPFLGETFASTGHYDRGGERRALRTSSCTDLAAASMYTTHPNMFRTDAEVGAFDRLRGAVRLQRFGGDCYSYCLLALGHVDLVVESSLQPYDFLPLVPIVRAAGGAFFESDGFAVAAATPDLLDAALALTKE